MTVGIQVTSRWPHPASSASTPSRPWPRPPASTRCGKPGLDRPGENCASWKPKTGRRGPSGWTSTNPADWIQEPDRERLRGRRGEAVGVGPEAEREGAAQAALDLLLAAQRRQVAPLRRDQWQPLLDYLRRDTPAPAGGVSMKQIRLIGRDELVETVARAARKGHHLLADRAGGGGPNRRCGGRARPAAGAANPDRDQVGGAPGQGPVSGNWARGLLKAAC